MQTACAPRGAPTLRHQEAPGSRGSPIRNAPGELLPLGSGPDALAAAPCCSEPRCAAGSGGGDVSLKAPSVSLVAGKLDDETTSAWALPPPRFPGSVGSARCVSPSLQCCRFEGHASPDAAAEDAGTDCGGGVLGECQAPPWTCSPDLAFLRSAEPNKAYFICTKRLKSKSTGSLAAQWLFTS